MLASRIGSRRASGSPWVTTFGPAAAAPVAGTPLRLLLLVLLLGSIAGTARPAAAQSARGISEVDLSASKQGPGAEVAFELRPNGVPARVVAGLAVPLPGILPGDALPDALAGRLLWVNRRAPGGAAARPLAVLPLDLNEARLAGGSAGRGRWTAPLPDASGDGPVLLLVETTDASGRTERFAAEVASGRSAAFQASPPTVGTVTVTPSTVGNAESSTVRVDVQLRDLPEGAFVWFDLVHSSGEDLLTGFPTLVSGTMSDGVWRADVEVPAFSRTGSWELQISILTDSDFITLETDGALVVTGSEDTKAPALSGTPTVNPSSVDLSSGAKTVTVTARLTDDVSGTDYVDFQFVLGDEYLYADVPELISGDAFDGVWQATAYLPENTPAGSWALEVFAIDQAGNDARFQTPAALTVGGGDNQLPTLTGTPTLTPTSVDVSGGAREVTIEVPIQDDAGVSYVSAYFELGDQVIHSGAGTLVSGTAASGVWRMAAQIPANAPPGSWTLGVEAWDVSNNLAEIATEVMLQVGGGDLAAPTLVGTPVLTPASVDLSAGAEAVTVTLTVRDEQSGVSEVTAYFARDHVSFGGSAARRGGTVSEGTWEATVQVPVGTPAGQYALLVELEDAAGNETTVETTVMLGVSGGDTEAPVLAGTPTLDRTAVQLDGGAQPVTARAVVRDEHTGVGTVYFTLRSAGGVDAVYGTAQRVGGDAREGSWRAALIVPQNTADGTYGLVVHVTDAAGNKAARATGLTLQVQGGDVALPVLAGESTLAPSALDLTTGEQTTTAAVRLRDATGISSVGLHLAGSHGEVLAAAAAERISGTAFEGSWQAPFTLPWNTPDGSYRLAVTAIDLAGNAAELSTGAILSVSGGDVALPALVGTPTVTPAAVDLSGGPVSVRVSVPVKDARSGLEGVEFRLVTADGQSASISARAALASGTVQNGTWTGEIPLTVRDRTGEYLLAVHVADRAGNGAELTTAATVTVTIQPPGLVSTPTPQPDETGVPERPALAWEAATAARSYDLYLWPSGTPRPDSATVRELPAPRYGVGISYPALAYGERYDWQVVARNDAGSREGPVWSFTVRQVPDLVVTAVELPPDALMNQEVEIAWTVTNAGPVPTDAARWMDRVYLSTDSLLHADTDLELGRFLNASYLRAGESHRQTGRVRLPDRAVGTQYLLVYVDADGGVPESGEERRNVGRAPLQIGLGAPPDLRVTRFDVPENVFSGREVELTWTVENRGSGATAQALWTDSLYVSPDSVLAGATIVDRLALRQVGRLEKDSSYTARATVELPASASGPYYVHLIADARDDVFEPGGETNNTVRRAMQVTLSPPPDLQVVAAEAPADLRSGEVASFEWTVANRGAGPARRSWTDRLFLSPTPTFDASTALLVGSAVQHAEIRADSSYTHAKAFAVPNGIGGTHYLFVRTDTQDEVFEGPFENNNVGPESGPVRRDVTLSPWADLEPLGLVASGASRAGDLLTVDWQVRNDGAAEARGPWRDSLFVAPSATWNRAEARPIGGFLRSQPLAAGASYTMHHQVRLPADLAGRLHLFVVTDAGRTVYEHTDEDNNAASTPLSLSPYPPVDLVATRFDVPSELSAGGEATVSWRVTNTGGGETLSRGWADAVYLSHDPTYDAGDVLLADVQREEPLAPAASYERSVAVRVPNDAAGARYLLVRADHLEQVADVSAANNLLASARVTVTPPPEVDLQVTSLEAPATLTAGQPVALQWAVRNAGPDAPRETSWVDAVYLSREAEPSRSSFVLGSAAAGALGEGGSYTSSLTASVPVYASGRYYLVVETDARDGVYEGGGEENNRRVFPVTVVQPPPSDLVVTDVAAPERAMVGDDVTVSWTVRNQGPSAAQGIMATGIYFSADETLDAGDALLAVEHREVSLDPGGADKFSSSVSLTAALEIDAAGVVQRKLPGLTPGSYHVLVRTDLVNNLPETNEENNVGASAGTVGVEVELLPLGVPLARDWELENEHFFAVDVAEGQDLRLTLTRDVAFSGGIYVAYDRVPSARSYDYAAVALDGPRKQVLVPSTKAGRYYVMVRSDHLFFDHESFTILAESLGFTVMEITPGRVGQGRVTTVLRGAGFRETSRARLENAAGATVAEGQLVRFASTVEMAVRWELADVPVGVYDVVVENAGGATARLEGGLEVEPVLPYSLEAVRSRPQGLVVGRQTTYVYQYRNNSNVDIPYADGFLAVLPGTELSVETDGRILTRGMIAERALADPAAAAAGYAPKGYIDTPGARIVPIAARNIAPGETIELRVTVMPEANDQLVFPIGVRWQLNNAVAFSLYQLERIEEARQAVLDNAGRAPSKLLALAEEPAAFAEFMLQGYAHAGLIEEEDLPLALELISTALQQAAGKSGSGKGSTAAVPDFTSPAKTASLVGSNICETMWKFLGCLAAVADAVIEAPITIPLSGPLGVYGVGTACTGAETSGLAYLAGCIGIFSGAYCIASQFVDFKDCDPMRRPFDPNDILGPRGYGDQNWVSVAQTLPYQIRFENDPNLATAAAQVVRITLPLDSTLDVRSFRLGSFAFGPYTFEVPAAQAAYEARLDLRDSLGLYVDVDAGVDVTTREAFWILRSTDPVTGGRPSDPLLGFLPVNDSLGRGEGSVSFTIRPDPAARTGDVITARASIVFDRNEPIATPSVQNTVDAGLPTSRLSAVRDADDRSLVHLSWRGSDDPGGSGLKEYALYVAADDEPYQVYRSGLTEQALTFTGELHRRYRFFVTASDQTGNREPLKAAAEGEVSTPVQEAETVPEHFALHQNYPNPFNPTTTIPFDLSAAGDVQLVLYDVLGRRVLRWEMGSLRAGRYEQQVDLGMLASGVYFYELRVSDGSKPLFRTVEKMLLVK